MSKSYGNTIGLREDTDSIVKKLKAMQTDPARVRRTDPGDPDKCPVWDLHKIYSTRRHSRVGAEGVPLRGNRLFGMQGAADRENRRGGVGHRQTGAGVRGESRAGTRYHRRRVRAGADRGARHHGCCPTSYGHELPMKPELTLVQNAAPPPPVPAPRRAAPAQGEMPFAVVEGQPIIEMPRDLYIPPQALEVFLEAFEGPLDMLLYLIRRQNLDILDIPIAEITRQYMRYIELMQVLQLELAGEYLLMAATLAEVKSRMLLPRVGSG